MQSFGLNPGAGLKVTIFNHKATPITFETRFFTDEFLFSDANWTIWVMDYMGIEKR